MCSLDTKQEKAGKLKRMLATGKCSIAIQSRHTSGGFQKCAGGQCRRVTSRNVHLTNIICGGLSEKAAAGAATC